MYNITGNHGFSFSIPNNYRDGQNHTWSLHAIDTSGTGNVQLSGSPKSFNCQPTTNTPPVITILGSNPLNLTVGQVFTDPGATALDAEDGNLTSSIVVTGTVNTSIAGTYTITYSVTDSGGLSDTKTRTVIVGTVPPTGATCSLTWSAPIDSCIS